MGMGLANHHDPLRTKPASALMHQNTEQIMNRIQRISTEGGSSDLT
jgi:hypothetical protein